MKLLLVDDNIDILQGVQEYLSLFYDVVAFDDSEDALQYLQHNPCDIVVSDYEMPHLTGLQLAEAVSHLSQHLVFLVMTGALDITPLERSAYIQHVIKKPFVPSKLHALIQRCANDLMLV